MEPEFSTDPNPRPVQVRGPAALAAVLPSLLETPAEGRIVLALVGADNRLDQIAHRPLPDYPAGASPELRGQWAIDVGGLVEQAMIAVTPDRRGAVAVFLPTAASLTEPGLAEAVGRCLETLPGEPVLDVIVVRDGRWRGMLCADANCCPPQGRVILDNSDALTASVALIDAGLSIAGSAPPQGEQVAAALASMAHPRSVAARSALLAQTWPALTTPADHLEAVQIARLALAADRPGVRDALLTRMARLGDAALWHAWGDVWGTVADRVPVEWVPGPACLLAITAWARADERQATDAVLRALAVDPDHRMAGLLHQLILSGTPAHAWLHRMSAVSEDACLRFDRPRANRRRARPAS